MTNKELDGVIAYHPTTGVTTIDLFLVLAELLVEIPARTSVIIVGVVCKLLFDNIKCVS